MLLGIVFLASVSDSLTEEPSRRKCVEICESEKDPFRVEKCQLRCKDVSERGDKEEEREIREHEEEQWRGRRRREDPEERERVRQRERERREEERRERERKEEEEARERERKKEEEGRERERKKEEEIREREGKKGEKQWKREKKEKWEEIEEDRGFPESDSQTQNNPFHFSSNRFRTLFKNQHGQIRVLQRFDQSGSTQLENLQDYRVVEFKSRPHTLLLPYHADADFLLVVLSGQ